MTNDQINKIGSKIDRATDIGDVDALKSAILECEKFGESAPPTIFYFLANAYFSLRKIAESSSSDVVWEWRNDYRQKELLYLRKAAQHIDFDLLHPYRKSQIYTNLGTLLQNTGRFIDGFYFLEKALKVTPNFGMALSNIPGSLKTYMEHIYDTGHKYLFCQKIYDSYAIDFDSLKYPIEPHAVGMVNKKKKEFCEWWDARREKYKNGLKMYHDRIEKYEFSFLSNLLKKFRIENFIIKHSGECTKYKSWCLHNNLFINPLNDLGSYSLAASDIYQLGSITSEINHGPYFHAMFDQMKQEFIGARYMFFCSIHKSKKTCADKNIILTDTLDGPSYGIAIEQMKTAYRTTYAIFDKIAYFLNKYQQLGHNELNLSFKNVWYKNGKYKEGLHSTFENLNNLPLRGLFWLSKDLAPEKKDDVNELHNFLEPQAQRISNIRNALEHGYVRIAEDKENQIWEGDFATRISKDELLSKTLYLQKLTRNALMYLGMSISIEEERQSATKKMERSIAQNVPHFRF